MTMTALPLIFVASMAIAVGLASLTIWNARDLRVKLAGVLLFSCFLPLVFLGWADLLSRPKPVALEWLQQQRDAEVIAGYGVENVAIYVWLRSPGGPRAYEMPWSIKAAQQLQDAQGKAGEGGEVHMRLERSYDPREPMFWGNPQPALPNKPRQ